MIIEIPKGTPEKKYEQNLRKKGWNKILLWILFSASYISWKMV